MLADIWSVFMLKPYYYNNDSWQGLWRYVLMLWRKTVSVCLSVALTDNFHATVQEPMKLTNRVNLLLFIDDVYRQLNLLNGEAVLSYSSDSFHGLWRYFVYILMLWRKAISVRLAVILADNFHAIIRKTGETDQKSKPIFIYRWRLETVDHVLC